ncbi:AAA family ATPase [Nocardia sp. NPDC056000]|uniref:helix-turn-helix transcriptional regulator n=1 Tax=Nocardia sp. NPDC056000 TaxID=3345674 RepID=UPI0035D952F5
MPQHTGSAARLYGREREREELDRVLSLARDGKGSAMILVGEPGIGKTTLLRYATAQAADFRVLTCRGVPSETELAFAGLHQLLWPILDRIDELPSAQATVLRGALGLGGHSGDRLLLGVAVLTLLSELAGDRPVLVVIDDLQLLDQPSRNCLRFVSRRIAEEPIAMLVAAHPGTYSETGEPTPVLPIRGLDSASAEQLVAEHNPRLSRARTSTLVRLTDGNPLALMELSRDAGVTLSPAASSHIALGPRLRASFDARLRELPESERIIALIAAADDGADARTVAHAAELLGVTAENFSAALNSELLRPADGRITVDHPLIRAAVYDSADPELRRTVHAALARVYADTDRERHDWHVAATATEPDETIAAMLDDAAERAWGRGGALAAARIYRRAAALSPDTAAAAHRLARAARAAWDGGDTESARELLEAAEDRAGADVVGAAGGGLTGLFELGQGDTARARRLLLRDAESAEPRFADELRHLALRASWALSDPLTASQLGAIAARTVDSGTDLPPSRLPIAEVAIAVGGEAHALRLYRESIERMRTEGPVTWLGYSLGQQAMLEITVGRWDDAIANAIEGLRLSEDFGGRQTPAYCYVAMGFIAALRGDEATALDLTDRALAFARPIRFHPLAADAYWCRALAALGAGRPDDAFELLRTIRAPEHFAHQSTIVVLSAADAAEAAVRLGRFEPAREYLEILTAHAELTTAAWASADAARVRALLATDAEAEALFLEALRIAPTQRPFTYARIQLQFGEWLRRMRRRRAALEQLHLAHNTFERLGARPWAERAEREIVMAGDRTTVGAVRSDSDPATVLTAQELQVARLAATGLTNREIAARLLISPRTVGNHLSHIFSKLGLGGRGDLVNVDFENGFRLIP